MFSVHEESALLEKGCQDVPFLKREEETIDEILGGQIKVIQKSSGYRHSVDAYLLAHFVYLKKYDHVLDMGTGSGVISLIVARRFLCKKVVGVEIQEEMVDMAKRSVALNDLGNMVDIRQGDIRAIETLFDPQSFDVVIFNPPYRKLKSGRINPDYQKSVARHEIKSSLNDFLTASKYVLKTSGRVYIIYPASRMVELMHQMRNNSIEPKKLKMVHSYDHSRGEFVLVEGIKMGREELEVLPPFFIYNENGSYTEAMNRLFRELSEFR